MSSTFKYINPPGVLEGQSLPNAEPGDLMWASPDQMNVVRIIVCCNDQHGGRRYNGLLAGYPFLATVDPYPFSTMFKVHRMLKP